MSDTEKKYARPDVVAALVDYFRFPESTAETALSMAEDVLGPVSAPLTFAEYDSYRLAVSRLQRAGAIVDELGGAGDFVDAVNDYRDVEERSARAAEDRAMAMYEAHVSGGMSKSAIAKELGYSTPTIHGILRRRGGRKVPVRSAGYDYTKAMVLAEQKMVQLEEQRRAAKRTRDTQARTATRNGMSLSQAAKIAGMAKSSMSEILHGK